ncbi:MAG: Rrf2 family transcriptional regulator [Oscillospiraceae bacterium]|jgi:Rrf2 family protein|nr:Rrf2 family transcriptional regulator [Oscillospiraceae bacterium]
MKITAKAKYTLRLLTDLAENSAGGYVPLKDVAERRGISKNYLEQIVFELKDTDWLDAARGTSGGYRLARPANSYTVADIVAITDGGVKPEECPEHGIEYCEKCRDDKSLKVWRGLDREITEYLRSISLQDILDDSEKLRC